MQIRKQHRIAKNPNSYFSHFSLDFVVTDIHTQLSKQIPRKGREGQIIDKDSREQLLDRENLPISSLFPSTS
jgi:hypothetical protein